MKKENKNFQKAAVLAGLIALCTICCRPAQLHAQDFLVGSWPYGICYTVDVAGNHAFMGNGSAISILDISSITAPVKVGEVRLNTLVRYIKHDGDRLYVCTESGFIVVDISLVSSPEIEFEVPFNGGTTSVDIMDTLIAVSFSASIRLFSIADPGHLPQVGSVTAYPNYAVFSGNTIFAATYQGIEAYDITDPGTITLISSIDTLGQCPEIAVNGNYAYVAGAKGIRVFDISDPLNILQESLISLNGVSCRGLYFDAAGDRLLGSSYYRTTLFDVTIPGTPAFISDHGPGEGSHKDPVFQDDHAFIAGYSGGMYIVDYTNPAVPSQVSHVPGTNEVSDIVVRDDVMYAAIGDRTEIIDISDIEDPVSADTIATQSFDLILRENELFILNYNGFKAYDISDPLSPVLTLNYYDGSLYGTNEFVLEDTLVYLLNQYSALDIVDISDYSAPVKIGSLDRPIGALHFLKNHDIMYLSDNIDYLRIVDISDPFLPVQLDSVQFGGSITDLELDSTILYAAAGTSIFLMDVSNPAVPEFADTLDLYWPNVYDLELDGNYIASTGWTNYFRYADITSPDEIVEKQETVNGYTKCMTLTEEYIFLGYFYVGIRILARDSILVPITDTADDDGGDPPTLDTDTQADVQSITLSPNPTTGILRLNFGKEAVEPQSKIQLMVYTITGQLVMQREFMEGEMHSIDLSPYGKGQYICRFQWADTIFTGKIIVE
jgi:hypothetical protein